MNAAVYSTLVRERIDEAVVTPRSTRHGYPQSS